MTRTESQPVPTSHITIPRLYEDRPVRAVDVVKHSSLSGVVVRHWEHSYRHFEDITIFRNVGNRLPHDAR